MAVRIGSNISSIQAQRRLGEATSTLSKTYEKLSSGQRINRASDDAAGLSIADGLHAKKRLYLAAKRNINDGVSALQIASNAIAQQTQLSQRMSELAEQSANGVYSDTQRGAMQREYQALVDESARIGETTSFNGVVLLNGDRDGGVSRISIQTGISGHETAALEISLPDTGRFSGTIGFKADINNSGSIVSSDNLMWRNTYSGGPDAMLDKGGAVAPVTVIDSEGRKLEAWVGLADPRANGGTSYPNGLPYPNWADAILTFRSSAGWTGAMTAASQEVSSASLFTATFTLPDTGATATVTLDLRSLEIEPLDWNRTVRESCIDFTGVETVARARDAMTVLANRSEDLARFQGQIGALLKRLDVAGEGTSAGFETSSAAESRIRDADISNEAANLTRSQIVQQTASAVLAQANQQPQIALQLLGG